MLLGAAEALSFFMHVCNVFEQKFWYLFTLIFFAEMTSVVLRNDHYSDDNFTDDESTPLTENIYGGR